MPIVGLGTWRMGNATATEANVALALSLGYRHLDCALGYMNQLGVGAAISASPRETQNFGASKDS